MIEFVTLFLGLVSGPHLVVVDVADTVAAVEVSLDGQEVGRMDGPPWQIEVDFGPDLVPRELVVVAEDRQSNPLDSARQLINVPRPPAEASLLLERDDRGRPVAVRLQWESSVAAQPLAVAATLDGRALEVDDPRHIGLGRIDPDELHFVQCRTKCCRTKCHVNRGRTKTAPGTARSARLSSWDDPSRPVTRKPRSTRYDAIGTPHPQPTSKTRPSAGRGTKRRSKNTFSRKHRSARPRRSRTTCPVHGGTSCTRR